MPHEPHPDNPSPSENDPQIRASNTDARYTELQALINEHPESEVLRVFADAASLLIRTVSEKSLNALPEEVRALASERLQGIAAETLDTQLQMTKLLLSLTDKISEKAQSSIEITVAKALDDRNLEALISRQIVLHDIAQFGTLAGFKRLEKLIGSDTPCLCMTLFRSDLSSFEKAQQSFGFSQQACWLNAHWREELDSVTPIITQLSETDEWWNRTEPLQASLLNTLHSLTRLSPEMSQTWIGVHPVLIESEITETPITAGHLVTIGDPTANKTNRSYRATMREKMAPITGAMAEALKKRWRVMSNTTDM